LKQAEEILHAMQTAEKVFLDSLEKQFKKPIQEIQNEILPHELEELKSQVPVVLSDGSEIGLKDAGQFIRALQSQHELATQLLIGALEGLAQQNDKQTNNYLKLGLTASHPLVKAKSINILGRRGMLSYAADIYPNLMNKNLPIRKAALNALLHSNETEAKQKTIELLNPQAFFNLLEAAPDQAGFEAYTSFLVNIAQNGDRYIEPLKNVATTPDFNIQARKLALLVIAMMAQQTSAGLVSPKTAETASDVLRQMSLRPAGLGRSEKNDISLYTTKLWLGLKEPLAIKKAFILLADPYQGLEAKQQEELLAGIFEALQKSSATAENADRLKQGAYNILANAADLGVSKEVLSEIKATLKPGVKDKLL
jgi:23S rRNA pseudoU1915 N3-methylase RlmH